MSETAPPAVTRKWLGRFGGWIIFGVFTGFWLLNLLFNWFTTHEVALSPNTLAFGGFGMTAALLYVFAYRLRPQDQLTPLRLVLAFLLGGLFTTELAFFVELFVSYIPIGSVSHSGLLVRALAGVIEESLKLAAVVIAARGLAVRNARNGLLLGGAVGLGFAAFEDMRYATATLGAPLFAHSQLASVIGVTLGRDLLGPLEHPIFTALIAAALFSASDNGRFRITGRVVAVFVGVAAAHGLIDSSPAILGFWIPSNVATGLGALVDLIVIIAAGIVWLRYSRRVRDQTLHAEAAPPESLAT
jgi:RsiW-degrading membrane proteinase PrsW (M82 family)